ELELGDQQVQEILLTQGLGRLVENLGVAFALHPGGGELVSVQFGCDPALLDGGGVGNAVYVQRRGIFDRVRHGFSFSQPMYSKVLYPRRRPVSLSGADSKGAVSAPPFPARPSRPCCRKKDSALLPSGLNRDPCL